MTAVELFDTELRHAGSLSEKMLVTENKVVVLRQKEEIDDPLTEILRRLKGQNQLPKIISGVKFRDGIEAASETKSAA